MENREGSSGLCEEIGGADVPWGGGTWGGDEPHGKPWGTVAMRDV